MSIHTHRLAQTRAISWDGWATSARNVFISQSRFETEEPSPHTHPAMNSRVFWRSPRTGTKCITSSAASLSSLPILKSDNRVTVNVAATNINTPQSDRWPIVSCWSYASTLTILGMSPFIILHSSFYVAGGESQLPNRDRCRWVFFVSVQMSFIWWCHHDEFFCVFSRNYGMSG